MDLRQTAASRPRSGDVSCHSGPLPPSACPRRERASGAARCLRHSSVGKAYPNVPVAVIVRTVMKRRSARAALLRGLARAGRQPSVLSNEADEADEADEAQAHGSQRCRHRDEVAAMGTNTNTMATTPDVSAASPRPSRERRLRWVPSRAMSSPATISQPTPVTRNTRGSGDIRAGSGSAPEHSGASMAEGVSVSSDPRHSAA